MIKIHTLLFSSSTAYILGLLVFIYALWLAIEAFWTPSLPYGSADKLHQTEDRLRAIVDTQWMRPGSLATSADYAAYESLLKEVESFDYAGIETKLAEIEKLELSTKERLNQRSESFRQTFEWLQPRIGDSAAYITANLIKGGPLYASWYRKLSLHHKAYVLARLDHQRSDLRWHYAMAFILAGEKDRAISELRQVIKETPDYALLNASYIIGARAGAHLNADFVREFEAVGGDMQRFVNDYVNDLDETKLYPFGLIGNYELR